MKFLPLLLAIEFSQPTKCAPYLDRSLVPSMANQLAFELAKQLPSLQDLGLAWMAASYDQAQLLRPGWPIHQALFELYQASLVQQQQSNANAAPLLSAQKNAGHVLSLQALRGQAPVSALAVEEQLLGGAFVVIPLCLVGTEAAIAQATAILEEKLLETGLTDARTALLLNQALCNNDSAINAEHARLMTLNDLAAMGAMQLEHAGFNDVWQAIEAQVFRAPIEFVNDVIIVMPSKQAANSLGAGNLQPNKTQADPDQPVVQLLIASWQEDIAEMADRRLRERQAKALLDAHHIVFSYACANVAMDFSKSPHYALQYVADAPLTQLQQVEVIASVGLGALAYRLLDADAQLIAYAHPLTASADQSIRKLPESAQRSKRLRWQCRRGTREIDMLLLRWLDQHYLYADSATQETFASILQLEDDQLWDYLIGKTSAPEPSQASLIAQIVRDFPGSLPKY